MSALPESVNFYGQITTCRTPEDMEHLYRGLIWKVRKCAKTDFELFSDFAELVMESSNPILIHGMVADPLTNWPRIIEPLAAIGLSGSFECYDDNDAIILQRNFGNATSSA